MKTLRRYRRRILVLAAALMFSALAYTSLVMSQDMPPGSTPKEISTLSPSAVAVDVANTLTEAEKQKAYSIILQDYRVSEAINGKRYKILGASPADSKSRACSPCAEVRMFNYTDNYGITVLMDLGTAEVWHVSMNEDFRRHNLSKEEGELVHIIAEREPKVQDELGRWHTAKFIGVKFGWTDSDPCSFSRCGAAFYELRRDDGKGRLLIVWVNLEREAFVDMEWGRNLP